MYSPENEIIPGPPTAVPSCSSPWRPLPDGPLPIPVEDNGHVLVRLSDGFIRSIHFSRIASWNAYNFGGPPIFIVYWMPLPKAQPVYGVSFCEHEKVKALLVEAQRVRDFHYENAERECAKNDELHKQLADVKANRQLNSDCADGMIQNLRTELRNAKQDLVAAYRERDEALKARDTFREMESKAYMLREAMRAELARAQKELADAKAASFFFDSIMEAYNRCIELGYAANKYGILGTINHLHIDLETVKKDREELAWNLAGCLTIAEAGKPAAYVRPASAALDAVDKMAAAYADLRRRFDQFYPTQMEDQKTIRTLRDTAQENVKMYQERLHAAMVTAQCVESKLAQELKEVKSRSNWAEVCQLSTRLRGAEEMVDSLIAQRGALQMKLDFATAAIAAVRTVVG